MRSVPLVETQKVELKFYGIQSLLLSFPPSLLSDFPNHIHWSGEQFTKQATSMLLKTWKLKVKSFMLFSNIPSFSPSL